MTRINANLPVKTLLDQHLFAEYREILMVPAALRRSLKSRGTKGVLNSIPNSFRLNSGHVMYFYDKLTFLLDRRKKLRDELFIRGYSINNTADLEIDDIPNEFKNDWTMTQSDKEIISERIMSKYDMKPTWYKYYGNRIDRNDYLNLLTE